MAESEIEDCREEQCQYRDELTQQLLLMEKQLKLRQLIIDHLIPLSEVQHVQDSHVYNEGMGAWLPRDTPTSDLYVDTPLRYTYISWTTSLLVTPHPLMDHTHLLTRTFWYSEYNYVVVL